VRLISPKTMNHPVTQPCRFLFRGAFLALVGAAGAAFGQEAARPAVAPESETVALPEFTVTSRAASEYAATESTTGTRVASKILDLPFVVNTVTSQFMEEFSLLEFAEQFAYTSNFVASENLWGGYNLRGFAAQLQLRNGFRRNGLSDRVNVDRAEVIKGPTAAIYGITTPSGAINLVTRRPQTKEAYRVSVSGGSHEFWRGEFSATGPISPHLFYRVDATQWTRDPDPVHKRAELGTVSGVLLFKPSESTSLSLEYEFLERREQGISGAVMPSTQVPNVQDPYRATGGLYTANTRLATELWDYNFQGPRNYSHRNIHNVIASFEHRFNQNVSLRSSANWWRRLTERNEVASRNVYRPDLSPANGGSISRGTPQYRAITEGVGGWQTDLLSHFETGPVKHKLLLTLDYGRHTQTDSKAYQMTNLTAGMPGLGAAVPINDPRLEYFSNYHENPALYNNDVPSLHTDLFIDVVGLFVSERAFLLDERLILLAGMRYDWVRNELEDHLATNPASRVTEQVERKLTYQAGLNYAVRPWLRVYANASTSFFPQIQAGNAVGISPVDGSTFALPNEEGHGVDAGIKVSAFEGNLSFTAGWFDITREKVADRVNADTSAGALSVTYVSGEQSSRGFESDFNWVATPELQFFGGYGYTEATYESHPLRWLIGLPLRNAPKQTVSLGTRYEFKEGALRGLYFTAGYRYNSANPTNPAGSGRTLTSAQVAAAAGTAAPFLNNPFPNGELPRPDLAPGAVIPSGTLNLPNGIENYITPSYHTVDVGLGYRWRSADRRFRHRVQLNGKNILDERYFLGSGLAADGMSWTLSYDLAF